MSAAETRAQGYAATELHCRVERGPVVIRIGDAALPAATVQPEMPGSEYVRVFDLVHAAVLRWSPNVAMAVSGGVPGLGGAADDCPVEDSIDALTYALVLHRSDLTAGTVVDPKIVATVLALAGNGGPDVPKSAEAWNDCLLRSLEIYDAVRKQGHWELAVDLEAGRVTLPGLATPGRSGTAPARASDASSRPPES